MTKQVFRVAFFASNLIALAYFSYLMSQVPVFYYKVAWYYAKAHFADNLEEKILIDGTFLGQLEKKRYSKTEMPVKASWVDRSCRKHFPAFLEKTLFNLKKSLFVAVFFFCGFFVFFGIRGIRARKKEHISGQSTVSSWAIGLRLRLTRKASKIKIGNLPLIKGTETRHILVSGGTGSGKTNCFHRILPEIRKQNQRAVVVDSTGEFVAKYYREGKDILLNPFDQRTLQWHPWCECQDSFDFKALVQSFIPSTFQEDESFWRKAAQEVFNALLQIKAQEKRVSSLTRLLFHAPLHILYDALKETKAGPFLDPSSEKTAGSVRAVAASYLECLELFPDTDTPFSIRNWVCNRNDDSWLFLTCTMRQRASMLPLLSGWFSIAMRSLLLMAPDLNRRLWFVADELPSLNRLKDLETCLTESRKYGGCALLAIQSPSQIEMIYGRDLARIIIGNCATRIAFTERDPEIAERISKSFGNKEIRELQEGISYGAHEMRDGVNLSMQKRVSPVVTPTDIQSLNTNEAYIRLPGNFPVIKMKLEYRT
ncbi:MAG: type IV secretion system DNA-binding domain-containing protein [Chlamydiales bacterium]|nr:type IV secretion system DNA-binding domain-containing protein [Chlamydiales bacterium]